MNSDGLFFLYLICALQDCQEPKLGLNCNKKCEENVVIFAVLNYRKTGKHTSITSPISILHHPAFEYWLMCID